jgi:hypothetical protein
MQGFDEFLQSSPALAMKYGMIADKYMAKGGMVKKYQAGGDVQFNVDTSSTAQQKADEYRRLLQQGYTNEQIRNAAETKFGKQTDQDWTTLTNLSGTTYNPEAELSRLAKNATSGGNTGVTTMPGGIIPVDDTFGTQVVVYGPDGKVYGNAEQARKAGVTNYTMTPPAGRLSGVIPDYVANYTPQQKADIYRTLLLGGYSDAEIRQGVEAALGTQNNSDWAMLTKMSGVGGTTPTANNALVIDTSIANKTAQEKVDYFNQLRSRGFTDAQIRSAVNSQIGVQTDADWATLTSMADINIPTGIENLTPEQKAKKYNELRNAGFTDEQIRKAVTTKLGGQTESDWELLQKIAASQRTTNDKVVKDDTGKVVKDDTGGGTGGTGGGTGGTGGTGTSNVSGQKYDDVGRPIADTVSTVTAAQTLVTPDMRLDATKYVAPPAPTAEVTRAQIAPPVATPTPVRTTPVTTVKTTGAIMEALAPLTPFTGTAPVIEAAQLTPEQMQAAMVQAQQLDKAQQVQLAQRRLQEGELVSGPTVDQQRVEQAIAQTQAAQGQVREEMTVQGQLAKLTADFDARNPPAWAAGAVRAATSQLAARGLGASSMAGQAIIQATMESAIPIASADAAVYQQMEAQNLSNRQQVALLASQQRAQFLGQEFDQSFQTRVLNAAKIADIANMNFTAEQQVYLENARLAQSVDLANLNNRQATVMANAATIANMQTANLSARQQSLVANAQNFLQMSMANMSNQQQVALFKAQELTQSIMSDAAAENAARQFNSSSQQQADQFNAQITTQVSQFNALQKNAMEQFNAGQTNALAQFNSQMKAQREEFNVRNRTIIDQANAQLLAQISLANTAATNAANFENARAMNNMTMSQYNNEVQLYRDQVKMVFDSYERQEDRATSMATAVLQANLAREKMDVDTSASLAKLIGSIMTGTKLGDTIIDFGKDFIKNLIGG